MCCIVCVFFFVLGELFVVTTRENDQVYSSRFCKQPEQIMLTRVMNVVIAGKIRPSGAAEVIPTIPSHLKCVGVTGRERYLWRSEVPLV